MLVAARRDAMGSSTARACHARTWRSTPSHRFSGISTAVAVAIPKRHAVSLSTPVHSILTERRLLNPAPTTFSARRSEEHTSELQSLMRISYAVFCLKKKIQSNKKSYQISTHKHIKC